MANLEEAAPAAVDSARLRALCEEVGFEAALLDMSRLVSRTCGSVYDEQSKATYALAAMNGVTGLLQFEAQQRVAAELRQLRVAVEANGADAVTALRGIGVRFDDLHCLTEARQAAIAGMSGNPIAGHGQSALRDTRQRLMEADRASVDAALNRA